MSKKKPESSSAAIQRKLKEIAACFEEQDYDYYLPGCLETLTRLLEIQPNHPEVHFWIARVYADLDEEKKAATHYREAIRFDGSYIDAYLFLADLHADDPGDTEYEILLRKTIDIDASCMQAWASLLSRMKYHKKTEEVEILIQQLISSNPDNPDAYKTAGDACLAGYVFETGDDERALAYYNKAIELDSGQIDYFYFRYFILFRLGRFEEALADLDKQKTLGTNSILDDSYFDVYMKMGHYDKALVLCNQLLPNSFDPYHLYYQRSTIYKAKGDLSI